MAESTKSFSSQIRSLILFFRERPQFILGFIGIALVVFGLIFGNKIGSTKVEVLQTPSTSSSLSANNSVGNDITVDVSGAVQKPGVYHLPSSSRVADAIVISGGLAKDADTSWIDKNLNRAAKLIDGQKVFIPYIKQSNVLSANESTTQSNVAQFNVQNSSLENSLININAASLSELDSLVGIGQVYAQKIIDQRPYSDVNELVSKKVIPQSTFNKIQDKISVY